ncbi:MAG: lysophospholipid acyltransferase family protein [Candidatus Margulisiibacteriota bacterium]
MIKRIFATLFFYVFFFVTFILGSALMLVLTVFGVPRRKAAADVSRSWATALLRIADIKVIVRGTENLFFDGPKVLVANHQGNFDIPMLMSVLPVNFRFLVKKELFSIPIFGWYLKSRGDISIDRKNGARASYTIRTLAQSLKDDDPVLIFPEGTRSSDGKVSEFKRGGVVLASASGAKIVPIGISGSFRIQKKGGIMIYPATIYVNIGPAFKDIGDEKEMVSFPQKLREKVISLIEDY